MRRSLLIHLCYFLILILLSFTLGGCGRGVYFRSPFTSEPPIVLHPINQSHIIEIPPGAWVEWNDMIIKGPDGKMTDIPGDRVYIEHWGYFLSNFYMEEVQEAKVE